jgi:hypothetical protein
MVAAARQWIWWLVCVARTMCGLSGMFFVSVVSVVSVVSGQKGKMVASFTNRRIFSGIFMSPPIDHTATPPVAAAHEEDVVESIAHVAPIILPIVGGVLMFLLAFIAVFLA